MKRLLLAFALLAVPLTAWCQAPKSGGAAPPKAQQVSPLAEYAGDWISTFEGKLWLLLQLELHGEQLTGSLTHSRDLEVNDDGGLKSVSDEKVKETVADATLNPDGLVLTVKEPDTQETYRYVMRLLTPNKDAGDLKMIAMDMPPGMPKPKPWVLVKFVPTATGKAPAPH